MNDNCINVNDDNGLTGLMNIIREYGFNVEINDENREIKINGLPDLSGLPVTNTITVYNKQSKIYLTKIKDENVILMRIMFKNNDNEKRIILCNVNDIYYSFSSVVLKY
jgi:hypothetical protein